MVRNGWSQGLLLGVVAGSDGHIGAPGWREGIAAVLAPELTRDALFDALLSRHAYATTHGDILLHFFGDGEITSTNGNIALVELTDNGEVVADWRPEEASSLRFESTEQVGEDLHYFYVRVTRGNGHQAWSSPIWVNYTTATP